MKLVCPNCGNKVYFRATQVCFREVIINSAGVVTTKAPFFKSVALEPVFYCDECGEEAKDNE